MGVAVGLLTHEEVVEAARAALRVEEDAVPHLVVKFVAAARGEVHADVGAARHLYPFALAAGLDKHRHSACAIVGREVERHLVARPTTLFVVEIDMGAIRQVNSGVAAVALALHKEIDTAIGVGHPRQDVAVTIGIKAHTEKATPPCAVHVDFKVHDTSVLEVEVEVGRSLACSRATYTRTTIGIPNGHGFIRGHVGATDIADIEVLR